MMHWALYQWHRLREWLLDLSAARHFREVYRHRDAGNRAMERAARHGATADWHQRQTPPREWRPRLWQRDGETRSETEERRP